MQSRFISSSLRPSRFHPRDYSPPAPAPAPPSEPAPTPVIPAGAKKALPKFLPRQARRWKKAHPKGGRQGGSYSTVLSDQLAMALKALLRDDPVSVADYMRLCLAEDLMRRGYLAPEHFEAAVALKAGRKRAKK